MADNRQRRSQGAQRSLTVAIVIASWMIGKPAAFGAVGPVTPPSIQVRCTGQWEAAAVSRGLQHSFGSLTDAMVMDVASKGQPATTPMFAVSVGVGHPRQDIELALDTSSGVFWLLEVGAQAFAGEFANVALYRSLGSDTANYITAAELRPRVHLALTPDGPNAVDIVGRIIADGISVAGVGIPMQPLVLAEHLPQSVKAWHLGGSLGLGLRSDAAVPLVDTWRAAWMEPAELGNASTPAEAARKSQVGGPSSQKGQIANLQLHITRPILSIWPEAEVISPLVSTSATQQLQSARPWARLRLGMGSLPGTIWAPLLSDAAGWAVDGHVSVGGQPPALARSTKPGDAWARPPPGRFGGRLLVDSTSPFLGVPAKRFASLILALVPPSIVRYCWWINGPASGLQVQCRCPAVGKMNQVRVEVGGLSLPLGARELWQSDVEGNVCTALIRAVQEPMATWHLGEPFLRRYAVTLDLAGARLGFSAPPPPGLDTSVKEDLGSQSIGFGFSEDPPVGLGGQLLATFVSTLGVSNFLPALVLIMLSVLVMVSITVMRSRGLIWLHGRADQDGWRSVALYPACADEEYCTALQRDGDDYGEGDDYDIALARNVALLST